MIMNTALIAFTITGFGVAAHQFQQRILLQTRLLQRHPVQPVALLLGTLQNRIRQVFRPAHLRRFRH